MRLTNKEIIEHWLYKTLPEVQPATANRHLHFTGDRLYYNDTCIAERATIAPRKRKASDIVVLLQVQYFAQQMLIYQKAVVTAVSRAQALNTLKAPLRLVRVPTYVVNIQTLTAPEDAEQIRAQAQANITEARGHDPVAAMTKEIQLTNYEVTLGQLSGCKKGTP